MNVHDFGAVGDGKARDHHAIQSTIDACADAGGGRVIVSAGRYCCGTIFLKSHVELHLLAGACIVGSPDRDDYNRDDVFLENHVFDIEDVIGAHLVIAYRCHDVAITGGTNNTECRETMPAEISHFGYHGLNDQPALPCALYAQRVHDLTLENVRLRWSNQSKVWRGGIIIDRCPAAALDRLAITAPSDDGQAVRVIDQ